MLSVCSVHSADTQDEAIRVVHRRWLSFAWGSRPIAGVGTMWWCRLVSYVKDKRADILMNLHTVGQELRPVHPVVYAR